MIYVYVGIFYVSLLIANAHRNGCLQYFASVSSFLLTLIGIYTDRPELWLCFGALACVTAFMSIERTTPTPDKVAAAPQQHTEIVPTIPVNLKIPSHPTYYDRRFQMYMNGGRHTRKEWLDLCEKYKHKCLKCKRKKKLTRDHVIPVYLGGTDNIDNIQPLCQSCNSSKGATYVDYRR